MAIEARRGCGYRKVGGTYLVSGGAGFACGRFPLEIAPCPLCDHRPPFTRGIQKVTPKNVLHASPACKSGNEVRCAVCPLGQALAADTAGLMWVGDKFYTPGEFSAEAAKLGVSKRIPSIPKWLEIGKTWVFLAHEKAITETCLTCNGTRSIVGDEGHLDNCEVCEDGRIYKPAVFFAFVVDRVERIIPDTMPEAQRAKLREQGLTLVEVPADDPDHAAGRAKDEE